MSMTKRPGKPRSAPPADAYWIYGWHALEAALSNPRRKIRRLLAQRGQEDRLAMLAKPGHPRCEMLDARELERLLPREAVHQGVAAEVAPMPALSLEALLQGKGEGPVVVLDQVTDPHNVGAILRSALAFGARGVVVTDNHSPPESAVMAKAASGALEKVPLVRVTNLAQAMESLKKAGYWVAGLDGEAKQALHETRLDVKTALVLGAEGKGLRRLTAERCDLLVRLPMTPEMESLNVSNAAAIALYQLFLRR